MKQGTRDSHAEPGGKPHVTVDYEQALIKHYVEDFDGVNFGTPFDDKWSGLISGSGLIAQVFNRAGGWVRLSVGGAPNPPGTPGTARIITKKPVFVCGEDPMSIFRWIAAFKAGAGPEGNPANCGPGGIASGAFIGITSDPVALFSPGSSGMIFDSPGPFPPGVPSPVWHYTIVQNGGSADAFFDAQVSENPKNPDHLGGNAKLTPFQGFGGVAIKVNNGPDKIFDPNNPYNEAVVLPQDINPGCEPFSMGTAYYAFALVGIPYPDIFGFYPPGCDAPATREIALDLDLFESKCQRIARAVGEIFPCVE